VKLLNGILARLPLLVAPLLLTGAYADCGGEPPVCAAIALLCEEGEVENDSNGDGCADECVPVATCLAFPVCDEGETEVEGPSDCLQDDAVCYENTVCGSTIWCTGETSAQ
jgi:hypothetical protein